MALTIICGKPGSGKSYFAVHKLAQDLLDWARYELKEEKDFSRVLYSNIPLNVVEFQGFFDAHGLGAVDAAKYIKTVDDTFFFDSDSRGRRVCKEWWKDFPVNAYILIDEVHQYLPQDMSGSKDLVKSFVDYVSTHRHEGHDLIFITQHTDNVHRSVLRMATDCYHVVNIKNKVLPLLNIPFSDFDVIKEAWGCTRQVVNILYGNYLGRSLRIQNKFSLVLKPEIFALYSSHSSEKGVSGDRPSLNLSRVGSILWFVRRHFFHVSFKLLLVYGAFWGLSFIIKEFPTILSEGLSDSFTMQTGGSVEESSPSDVESIPTPPVPSLPLSSPLPVVSDVPVVYGVDYVILRSGKKVFKGDVFSYEGKDVILQSVDFRSRVIVVDDLVRLSDPVDGESGSDADIFSEVAGSGK